MVSDPVEVSMKVNPLFRVLLLHVIGQSYGRHLEASEEIDGVLSPSTHEVLLSVEELLHDHQELTQSSRDLSLPRVAAARLARSLPRRPQVAHLCWKVGASINIDAIAGEFLHNLTQRVCGQRKSVRQSSIVDHCYGCTVQLTNRATLIDEGLE
jgi:hypothetical protein